MGKHRLSTNSEFVPAITKLFKKSRFKEQIRLIAVNSAHSGMAYAATSDKRFKRVKSVKMVGV